MFGDSAVVVSLAGAEVVSIWSGYTGGTDSLGVVRGPAVRWSEMSGGRTEAEVLAMGSQLARFEETSTWVDELRGYLNEQNDKHQWVSGLGSTFDVNDIDAKQPR